MPYRRPKTKKGFFKKYEFVYDEYFDCYICPQNNILNYKTTNREGYNIYESSCNDCVKCPYLKKCTEGKVPKKIIARHVWENYVEQADHLRHTDYNKKTYKLRSQTIERVFADMKEKHGLRYTTLRGISKIKDQSMLVFACQNLKKLALWKW